ncbi:MAG: PKD domain-containing protein [Myxococcota bacterium]
MMRVLVPLVAAGSILLGLLGCSENSLSTIPPKDDTDEPEELVDIPPPPPPPGPVDPIADAGPDRVWATGDMVTLDASNSYDPQGLDPLVYAWTLSSYPVGSSAQVSALDVMAPTFVADVAGTFEFELTVMNTAGMWDQTPATVTITVEDEPVFEPVANAGPDQTLDEGNVVQLDGTGSFDPQGLTPLVYQWQMVQRPAGSVSVLDSNSSPTPSFLADQSGTYVIEMTVRNSAGVYDSTPDQLVVTSNEVILPPIANAGLDIATNTGQSVTLNGNGSTDPQGLTPLSYVWTFTLVPSGSSASLSQAGTATPTFTPDVAGLYVAELAVGNTANLWDLTPDKVNITVTDVVVEEPVADAGADFGVLPLENVQLDGTGSYDPAGLTPLTYQWTMVGKPSGSTASLNNTAAAQPTFFADLAGAYVFELTVMNANGVWDTTPDQVTVESIPIDGFYVEVSWDNDNDLDLHVLNGTTPLWGDGDCNYCNMNPNWGGSGALDNPSLDADAIYGYGPETTTIDAPAAGTYEIAVHYYGLNGSSSCGSFSSCPQSTATVRVYLGGILAHTFTRVMDDAGQVWTVGSISWPSGAVTAIDSMGSTSSTYCN